MSGGHGAGGHGSENKTVALIIAILALMLAVAEILGQKAQTETLQKNIEASNLWSFFQAKTIRMTTLRTAAEALEVDAELAANESAKAVIGKRVASWKKTADRYESEPETKEGRKELAVRAKDAEKKREEDDDKKPAKQAAAPVKKP